jgi:hypothetical protein
MKQIILFIIACFFYWFVFLRVQPIELGPGVHAPDQPVQTRIDSVKHFQIDDFKITPLAKFEITAKLLSRKDYSRGVESRLSPVDMALGWGHMSDESVIKDIKISQRGRWYYWRSKNTALSNKDISTHSANMHLIPENDLVAAAINQAGAGDLIHLQGQLVRVDRSDGWRWISSLTRNDTGARSCELIYVKEFAVVTNDL